MIVSSGRSVAELVTIELQAKGVAIRHALFYCAISSTGRASVSKIDGVGSSPAWRARFR